MKRAPQTAIRGIFSVGLTNFIARLVGYGKHVLIAAYIGLTAPLDAFYMAMSILSLAIFTFGDVFDSLGVPRLVGTLQKEGEDSFRAMAGSILAFSLLLTLLLGVILLLTSPWLPWIAPGFNPDKKILIQRGLFFLFPVILLYLPYHAMGSFLRSRRRFQVFYLSELIVAVVSLLVIVLWREYTDVVPVSVSISYFVAFLYILFVSREEFRFPDRLIIWDKIREFARLLMGLLPLYLVGYLFAIVDRVFASYLATGGVSALTYGMLIAMIPASVLMMENIFITPLSESDDKGEMIRNIMKGILIISIPLAIFSVANSRHIVRAALERGVFTSLSTEVTSDALTFLAISIPATFINPVSVRLFQILGKLKGIAIVGLSGVVVNAALNCLFLRMGFGIQGLALATSVSYYVISAGIFILLERLGIRILKGDVIKVLGISTGIGLLSLAIAHAVPLSPDTLAGILLRGTTFLVSVLILVLLVPNRDFVFWRKTVAREVLRSK